MDHTKVTIRGKSFCSLGVQSVSKRSNIQFIFGLDGSDSWDDQKGRYNFKSKKTLKISKSWQSKSKKGHRPIVMIDANYYYLE